MIIFIFTFIKAMIDSRIFNNSSIISAMSMLIMYVASRYLQMEFGYEVTELMKSPIARKLVVFCIIFVLKFVLCVRMRLDRFTRGDAR